MPGMLLYLFCILILYLFIIVAVLPDTAVTLGKCKYICFAAATAVPTEESVEWLIRLCVKYVKPVW